MIDVAAASSRLLQTNEPYMMLSGYRSPRTNAMLRRQSSGVAQNSLHLTGKAADLRLKSRSVGQMYQAAVACRAGGVGRSRNVGPRERGQLRDEFSAGFAVCNIAAVEQDIGFSRKMRAPGGDLCAPASQQLRVDPVAAERETAGFSVADDLH